MKSKQVEVLKYSFNYREMSGNFKISHEQTKYS